MQWTEDSYSDIDDDTESLQSAGWDDLYFMDHDEIEDDNEYEVYPVYDFQDPLVPHREFESRRVSLYHKLEQRPPRSALIEQNIIKNTPENMAPCLAGRFASIKFQRLQDEVSHKLTHRPDVEQLMAVNIIKFDRNQVAPSLQSAHARVQFKQHQARVQQKLVNRPSKANLLGSHILHESGELPNNIEEAQSELQKKGFDSMEWLRRE